MIVQIVQNIFKKCPRNKKSIASCCLPEVDFQKMMRKRMLPTRFFQSVLLLKNVKRAGWVSKVRVNNPESVADHTYSMCAMCMVLSDMLRLDTQRVMKMVILHDLADPTYPMENKYKIPHTDEKMVLYLESEIDKFDKEVVPITFFILPGGSIESSILHVSRSIARRTETAVTALSKSQTINPAILIYLNRLSDLLFVAARLVNKRVGVEDVAWKSSSRL